MARDPRECESRTRPDNTSRATKPANLTTRDDILEEFADVFRPRAEPMKGPPIELKMIVDARPIQDRYAL